MAINNNRLYSPRDLGIRAWEMNRSSPKVPISAMVNTANGVVLRVVGWKPGSSYNSVANLC